MSRFSKYGALDTQYGEERDSGFIGFNNRIRPDLLKQGILSDSQNGRMTLSGEWQVRKGIDNVTTSLITSTGITLPFTLNDSSAPVLNDSGAARVWGSCSFSDPSDSAGHYIIVAQNSKAVAIDLRDGSKTDLTYPSGYTLGGRVSMIQALNKVIIFKKGSTALSWDGNFSNNFVKVDSGSYTQPQLITTPNSGFSINNNLAVVDLGSGTHGLSQGDIIEVITSNSSGLTVGQEFTVSEIVDANEFKFFVNSANVTASSSVVPVFSKAVSSELGFTHMPAPEFGSFISNRLVVPKAFTVNSGADSFTANNEDDAITFSDILDINTYENFSNQFNLASGSSDFVVGFLPFSEDKLLVFMRNSIVLINGTANPKTATKSIVTTEVGCVARDTIVQVGNNILFLSDNGIYGASFQDLYNLRGNELPLSESIDSTIQNINKNEWHYSKAVYFDNRYYIAVPIGTNQSRVSTIIVYNFLNKQWESIDSVSSAQWDIDNLIVHGSGSLRAVYAISSTGGVHRIDSASDATDTIAVGTGTSAIPISPQITTRQFDINSIERKKWNSFEMLIGSSDTQVSDLTITANTQDIDYTLPLGTLSEKISTPPSTLQANEEVSIRGRIGNARSYGIQFTLDQMQGRPKIKSINVTGAETFKSTNKAI
tara:strand:+ start:70 stop:2031 length:1962 start_codon:yes stop_codon:yes gene_type:complete